MNTSTALSESGVPLVEAQVPNELLIQELRRTVSLLEQAAVPGSEADRVRLEQRLASDMASYFKALADAVPWQAIEELYYRHAKPE